MKLIKQIEYTEKHSRFIGYRFQVQNKDEAKEALSKLKEEHKKAKHFLRASRISNSFGIYVSEANENQEPVSSMKKLASLLDKKDIKDCLIIIVRYFGGTKLGASHLDAIYFDIGSKLLNESAI